MYMVILLAVFFLFKQKTAYEMRISDWSSDVCSSDLQPGAACAAHGRGAPRVAEQLPDRVRQRLGVARRHYQAIDIIGNDLRVAADPRRGDRKCACAGF